MKFNIAIVTSANAPYGLARSAALLGAVAAVLFLVCPGLDLDVARLFLMGDGKFIGHRSSSIPLAREAFKTIYIIASAVVAIGLVAALRQSSWRSSISSAIALYMALCLSIGPGLIANILLKDQSGRARPSQIADFGGTKPFTPALVPARHCERNCSFVSGEASSMFAMFFALALIIPQWSTPLIAVGVLTGLTAGIVRMAQGAHFLSDVIFAGIFMALVVAAVHWLVFSRTTSRSLNLTLTANSQ